jgi:uncharacterized membrane protein
VKVHPLRHRRPNPPLQGAFGQDRFGRAAERFARFFGTPTFVIAQTVLVFAWIVLNAGELLFKPFDPFPYVLLNLAFSTQAAYAAPLILLAQTRQADRDKATTETDMRHREEVAQYHVDLLHQNTELTERVASLTDQVADLTKQIHHHVTQGET